MNLNKVLIISRRRIPLLNKKRLMLPLLGETFKDVTRMIIREPKSVVRKDIFTKIIQNYVYFLHRIMTYIVPILYRRIYNNKR